MPYRKVYRKSFKKKGMKYQQVKSQVVPIYRRSWRHRVNVPRSELVRAKVGAFGAPSVAVQTGRLPFSNMGFYRLPYSESFAISANGSIGTSVLNYTYNLGSIYDPRTQLGGGQPMQADLIFPAYERYWVRKCQVSITFSNPDFDGMLVGFRVRNSTNAGATTDGRTIAEIKEMDLTRSRWIHNTGNQTTNFKATIYPWQIMGITKAQYNNIEYSALTNANPTAYPILEPFALHTVAEQVATVRCTVRILYYVQLTNRQTILDV